MSNYYVSVLFKIRKHRHPTHSTVHPFQKNTSPEHSLQFYGETNHVETKQFFETLTRKLSVVFRRYVRAKRMRTVDGDHQVVVNEGMEFGVNSPVT